MYVGPGPRGVERTPSDGHQNQPLSRLLTQVPPEKEYFHIYSINVLENERGIPIDLSPARYPRGDNNGGGGGGGGVEGEWGRNGLFQAKEGS